MKQEPAATPADETILPENFQQHVNTPTGSGSEIPTPVKRELSELPHQRDPLLSQDQPLKALSSFPDIDDDLVYINDCDPTALSRQAFRDREIFPPNSVPQSPITTLRPYFPAPKTIKLTLAEPRYSISFPNVPYPFTLKITGHDVALSYTGSKPSHIHRVIQLGTGPDL